VLRHLTLPTFLCLASLAAPAVGQSLDLVASPDPVPGQTSPRPPQQPVPRQRQPTGFDWRPGQPLMQGFFGVTYFDDVSVEDGFGRVDGDKGDLDDLPVIGGGGQFKLGGERIDWGLEGLLSFAWRSDATAFVVGGGGAAVAVDVDLLLFELYGGPFASVFLGDKLRLYGAAGPILQWASYDQSGTFSDDGSGFGSGLYARTGLEFALASRTLIGFGVRWSDTSVDLSGALDELEIDGFQALFTVSQGL